MKKLLIGCVVMCWWVNAGAASQKVRVLLDWFVNPNHASLFAAQYSGAFARQGLSVDLIAPADSASVPLLLAAGKADIAISYQPQLYTLVEKKVPVIRVGSLIDQPLNTLTTLSPAIHSLADFKGKTIGYAIPGFEDIAIKQMLAHAGVDPSSVTLVNLNMAATTALLTHRIDGAMTIYRNYELLSLQDKGVHPTVFRPEQAGIPAYDELILLAQQNKAKQSWVKAFLTGLDQGTAWLKAHPEQAWQAFIQRYPEMNTQLNHQAWQATIPLLAQQSAAFSAERYQKMGDFLQQNHLISQVAPLSRYVQQAGEQ
ncbi:ABC transporter substrate-binding protein [Tatumella sp. OPLPL6]|uniref:ABC transporter substrate-binding protein n=1 Tax=Tatumella sp. OPLPL6 TaxID=1928657 RepID=UPI0025710CEC|nr:ABC transporter substrate-binding protein [Tatumella sp. OPLPL6]